MADCHSSSRLASSKGFTLIEMMMAIGILGLLASFAIPRYQGFIEQARIQRGISEIRYLDRDIQAYVIANEKYPATLGDLHLSINSMLDPWENPYQYLLIATGPIARHGGGVGPYYALSGMNPDAFYARDMWRLDFVASAVDGDGEFWRGSWFVSEAWAAGGPISNPRKDRFNVPINSDYDLYSMGPDGESVEPLIAAQSHDDIVRGANGAFVGLAENF